MALHHHSHTLSIRTCLRPDQDFMVRWWLWGTSTSGPSGLQSSLGRFGSGTWRAVGIAVQQCHKPTIPQPSQSPLLWLGFQPSKIEGFKFMALLYQHSKRKKWGATFWELRTNIWCPVQSTTLSWLLVVWRVQCWESFRPDPNLTWGLWASHEDLALGWAVSVAEVKLSYEIMTRGPHDISMCQCVISVRQLVQVPSLNFT